MAGEAEHGGSGFNIHPMDQFKVTPLFGGDSVHWYTPTNATLWMLLTVLAITLVMVVGARGRALIPSRAQSAAEVQAQVLLPPTQVPSLQLSPSVQGSPSLHDEPSTNGPMSWRTHAPNRSHTSA